MPKGNIHIFLIIANVLAIECDLYIGTLPSAILGKYRLSFFNSTEEGVRKLFKNQ